MPSANRLIFATMDIFEFILGSLACNLCLVWRNSASDVVGLGEAGASPVAAQASLRRTDVLIGIGLFSVTLGVYFVSNLLEGPTPYNFHVLLANAFINGRIDLPYYSWLELAEWQGKYYTVFPPMPGILLSPFALIWGAATNQAYFSIVMGALNVVLCFATLRTLFESRGVAVWVSILHAFGTIHWYHAEVGSGWYCAHIVAITFLWLSLLVALRGGHFFWAGLFLSAASLSRYPVALGGAFIAVYFFRDFFRGDDGRFRLQWRNGLALAAGLAPAPLAYLLYNYLRFGGLEDLGYTLVLMPNDPSYPHGLFDLRYIGIHLREMFWTMPRVIEEPPYLAPSLFAMSIWIATPALFLVLRAPLRARLTLASAAAVVVTALLDLSHGGNGFTQFGYRHTLDFLPFLLILVASGMRERVGWFSVLLILSSIVVNTWGVVTLSVLKIHGF